MAVVTRIVTKYKPELCPPLADATANPQFVASTAVCRFIAPRNDSSRDAKKQDMNPNSPSYQQWLKVDNTYAINQAQGSLFPYDVDAVACPIFVNKQAEIYATIGGGGQYTTIIAFRNNGDSTSLIVSFDILVDDSLSDGFTGPYQIIIDPYQYQKELQLSLPARDGHTYYISNITTNIPEYIVSGGGTIVGTPIPVIDEEGGGGGIGT